jgi:hypothetical protein
VLEAGVQVRLRLQLNDVLCSGQARSTR